MKLPRQPIAIALIAIGLSACKKEREPPDPKQVEFNKRFDREAVLVMTCPGDPRWGSGPTAFAQRVYRFERELWYTDADVGLRKVEATPETVCAVLTTPRS